MSRFGTVERGTLCNFNDDKRFGFIEVDGDYGNDVFLHITNGRRVNHATGDPEFSRERISSDPKNGDPIVFIREDSQQGVRTKYWALESDWNNTQGFVQREDSFSAHIGETFTGVVRRFSNGFGFVVTNELDELPDSGILIHINERVAIQGGQPTEIDASHEEPPENSTLIRFTLVRSGRGYRGDPWGTFDGDTDTDLKDAKPLYGVQCLVEFDESQFAGPVPNGGTMKLEGLTFNQLLDRFPLQHLGATVDIDPLTSPVRTDAYNIRFQFMISYDGGKNWEICQGDPRIRDAADDASWKPTASVDDLDGSFNR